MNNKKYMPLIIMGTMVAGICLGAGGIYYKNRSAIEYAEMYPKVIETYDFMKETVEMLPSDVSLDVQVNSFLELYDDKYTYFRLEEIDEENKKTKIINKVNSSPTACGSGFEIDFDGENNLFFSDITQNMPIYEQGFRSGDRILSVDGNEVDSISVAEKLMGKSGTNAELLIERADEKIKLTLTRYSDSIKSEGIEYWNRGNMLYIKYPGFSLTSGGAFEKVLNENPFDSLIIDLRGNSGGEVSVAVGIADNFINGAKVETSGANGFDYFTNDGVKYNMPIILLVDEKTASSAEIFTALLKQYADTTIIGTNTFGKGICQNYAFFNNGYLQYTSGYVTVGEWECYHGKGIAPDIEIEMDSSLIGTDKDIQLQKAIEILK